MKRQTRKYSSSRRFGWDFQLQFLIVRDYRQRLSLRFRECARPFVTVELGLNSRGPAFQVCLWHAREHFSLQGICGGGIETLAHKHQIPSLFDDDCSLVRRPGVAGGEMR